MVFYCLKCEGAIRRWKSVQKRRSVRSVLHTQHADRHRSQCCAFDSADRNPFVSIRAEIWLQIGVSFNPLIATLKLQSNRPSYSNTVIGTLAVDWWAVCYIWYSEEGTWRGCSPSRPLLDVPNVTVTAHPSTASVPTSYYSMWHYNYLWSLKR